MRLIPLMAIAISISTQAFCNDNEPKHRLVAVRNAQNYRQVKLADSSVWKVEPQFFNRVREWLSNDQVIIYPVTQSWYSYFSTTKYAFYNVQREEYVLVTLELGPKDYKSTTTFITDIKRKNNGIEVTLGTNDGRQYYYTSTLEEMKGWKLQDPVSMGSNNSPNGQLAANKNHIVINLRTEDFLRVNIKK